MDPIIIIGAGLLAFFLWSQSQGAIWRPASDAAFTSEVAAGTAATVPQSWASGASAAPGTATTAHFVPVLWAFREYVLSCGNGPDRRANCGGCGVVECAYSCPRA